MPVGISQAPGEEPRIARSTTTLVDDGCKARMCKDRKERSKARFIVRNFSDNFLLKQKITGLASDCLPTNPH